MSAIVTVIVGVVSMPYVKGATQTYFINNSSNIINATASSTQKMISTVPILFAIGIGLLAITLAFNGLREFGLIGGKSIDDDYDEDDNDYDEDEEYEEPIKKLELPKIEIKEEDIVRSKYD